MLAVGVESLATAGEDFVSVGLVSYVPDDLVFRGVEHVMQCHGQFHHPQACPKVSSLFGDDVDNELTKLVGDVLKFLRLELAAKVCRNGNLGQRGSCLVRIHGVSG